MLLNRELNHETLRQVNMEIERMRRANKPTKALEGFRTALQEYLSNPSFRRYLMCCVMAALAGLGHTVSTF